MIRPPPPRSRAVLVGALVASALLGGVPAPARAAGELEHLVVLLRPAEIDELTREALARITGELAAARLRVVIVPLDAAADPIEQVENAGGDLAPVAAFALVRAAGGVGVSVELWVSDRLAHRTTIQRLRVQDGDVSRAAEVLAVESVEQIRISLSQFWPRPAKPLALRREEAPRPLMVERVSMVLGVGVLTDLGRTAPVWSAAARVGYMWPSGWSLFLAARGLGPSADFVAPEGTARVRRQAAWLGVAKVFRVGQRVQPVLSLAGGAEYLRAQGVAPEPARVHLETTWTALATAGAGLAVALVPRLALVLEAEGVLFYPRVVVQIGDRDVARFDRPALLLSGGFRVGF